MGKDKVLDIGVDVGNFDTKTHVSDGRFSIDGLSS